MLVRMSFPRMREIWLRLAAFPLLVYTVGRGLLDWAGAIDLVISRYQEPGWIGAMLNWLLDPPEWFPAALTATGLALLFWDNKRRHAALRKPDQTVSATPILRDLSNSDLVARVKRHAGQLRAFQNEHDNTLRRIMLMDRGGEIEEERRKKWHEMSNASIQHSTDVHGEFRSRFLPESQALEVEILRRLGRRRPEGAPRHALDDGMLAGVAPILEVASYLERQANDL